jgi:hypothetical protein
MEGAAVAVEAANQNHFDTPARATEIKILAFGVKKNHGLIDCQAGSTWPKLSQILNQRTTKFLVLPNEPGTGMRDYKQSPFRWKHFQNLR